jgi:hypothetical protein
LGTASGHSSTRRAVNSVLLRMGMIDRIWRLHHTWEIEEDTPVLIQALPEIESYMIIGHFVFLIAFAYLFITPSSHR